jgi:hypothetical protein
MTPTEFETQTAVRFPSIADSVVENRGLVHAIMGELYRYAQAMIAASQWSEVERVFRFLEDSYEAAKPTIEIENAIRVSFLEYFEFQQHEKKLREMFGPTLERLYDDQMLYMENLAQAANDRSTSDPDSGYWG